MMLSMLFNQFPGENTGKETPNLWEGEGYFWPLLGVYKLEGGLLLIFPLPLMFQKFQSGNQHE